MTFTRPNFAPLLLALIIFTQNPPWPIWSHYYLISSCLIITLFFVYMSRSWHDVVGSTSVILVLFACLYFFVAYQYSFGQVRLSSLVTILAFILTLLIRDNEGQEAFDLLTAGLSWVIFISGLFWIINLAFSFLPYENMVYADSKGASSNLSLRNYYFFISSASDSINRFYSVFDEPGVLGTLAALLLFGGKYNLRNKKMLVIFFGGVLSFSLAFYVLTFAGILMKKNIISFSAAIKASFFVGVMALIFLYFNLIDTFSILIIDRAFNIDDAGVRSRTSEELVNYFSNYVQSKNAYLGMGTKFFAENPALHYGQTYKLFLIESGFVGAFLLLAMYLSVIKGRYSRDCLALLILFLLSFLQRPFMFTAWQIILFGVLLANLRIYKLEKLDC